MDASSENFLGDAYVSRLAALLRALDEDEVRRLEEALIAAHRRGSAIYVMGNGGSASSASHWANDLTRWRERPFRVTSLVDNASIMTAYANDVGFESVFSMQLENLMRDGDVVMVISASGNSENLVRAVEYASGNGGVTVALTGFDGGRLRQAADICVHVASDIGEYGPVEDIHMLLGHLVTERIWSSLAEEADDE